MFLTEIFEQSSPNYLVIYPGRFQPFHKGHFATYQLLTKKFGKENVYIGTTNKTDNIKSPFGFKEKKYIITKMFGIPANKIVQIKNPYAPVEILDKYDSKNTAFITAVGEKDEMRLGGKYFEKYKDNSDLEGYLDKGYVYISPSQPNPISGTDVRNWLGKGNEEDKKKGFMKAYPKFDEKVFKLITLTLGKLQKESLVETTLGGYGADEGEPATMYIPDGTKRILDRGKPEPWFKQLGYTQIDKPKADTMRGKGRAKDKESTFRKVYYKVSNMVTSDLKPVEKPKGVDGWKQLKKEDVIKGGLAAGMSLKDIAKKHNVSEKELADEFRKGYKVEREHTNDTNVAKEIALDHLFEDPKYYTKLSKIENPLNESFDIADALLLSLIQGGAAMGIGGVASYLLGGGIQKAKDWWKNHKDNAQIKKIVNRLKNDDEVKSLLKNPTNKGWKELIKSKLSNIELHYLNQITKKQFENINESLILEGGAYGHMNHPFDIEMNLTFGDLKRIVKQALSGKLELAREKTDGQALAISWVNGRLVAARNKSHLKNKGKDAMSVQDVISKFAGRGSVSDAFSFAIKDLESAIKGLSDTNKKKIFKDGKCFMNCEIIYPENTNVIPYGQSLLVFHGTMEYNDEGTAIGENPEAGAQLAAMVKKVNADVQSKFKLQGPPIQKLPVNKDLKSKQSLFLSKIQSLQNEFGLTEKNGVADYHQAWWLNFVNKNTKGLDEQQKIGLVKRWAFGDKGFRIKDIKDEKNREWAEKIEKQDQQKITKENLLKFETIFLGVGAEVLSFMTSVLTVNPDAAKQQMVGRLETAINSIRATGDAKNLDKLEVELARIEALGGFEKIVPNEGIVFNYKGNTFKLTGAFAPLNQILGIFTFSR